MNSDHDGMGIVRRKFALAGLLLLALAAGGTFGTVGAFAIKSEAPLRAVVAFVGGGGLERGSLFALGAIPAILAWLPAVALIAKRRLRESDLTDSWHGNWQQRRLQNRARTRLQLLAGLACVLVLAAYVTPAAGEAWLHAYVRAVGFYFAGVVIVTAVIRMIDLLDVVDGAMAVFTLGCLASLVQAVAGLVPALKTGTLSHGAGVVIVASLVAGLGMVIWLERLTVNVPLKTASGQPLPPAIKGLQNPSLAPFGCWNQLAMETIVLLACTGVTDWLVSYSQRWPGITGTLIAVGGSILLVFGYSLFRGARLGMIVRQMAQRLEEKGWTIADVPEGPAPGEVLFNRFNRVELINNSFLLAAIVGVATANRCWHLALPALLLVSLWAPVQFIRALVTEVELARIYDEMGNGFLRRGRIRRPR